MSKTAEYTDIINRNLNRWEKAIEAARAANYPPERFAADVTNSWADWAYFSVLPLSVLGVSVTLRPAVPTIEFIVTDKTQKMPTVVELPDFYTAPVAAGNLTLRGLGAPPQIPAARVSATLAGDYLYVVVDVPKIAAGLAADVYQGDVIDAASITIARVKVVWPG